MATKQTRAKRTKRSGKPGRSRAASQDRATVGEVSAGKPMPRPSARARFAGVSTERERLEKSVQVERADRMAEYAARIRNVEGPAAFAAAEKLGVLRILAEGDSWFDYPL